MDGATRACLIRWAIAGGVAIAAACAFYPALGLRRGRRAVVLTILCCLIVATPTLIPRSARLPRVLAAVTAVTLVVKLYDLDVGAAAGVQPGALGFLAFLPNIFSLVHRKLDAAPHPPAARDMLRGVLLGAAVMPAGALLVAAFKVDWTRYGFATEHAAKVVLFFLMLIPLANAAAAVWRLAGGKALDFMDNPFAARTPADFWRRYNRPVHQFMGENVFPAAGGRRHRVRGALAVFLVSAAVHEYVFSIAVGRVQGYQTAFFLLQGLGVAATMRVRPRGPAAVASVAATFLFNLASGVLFFASVNGVLPFYQNRVPLWDPPGVVGAATRSIAAARRPRTPAPTRTAGGRTVGSSPGAPRSAGPRPSPPARLA